MRIISDFHDYYDCGMHYGMDKDLIYLRKKKILGDKQKRNVRYAGWYRHYACDSGVRIITHTVGFCGKTWTCYEMYMVDKPAKKAFCYTIEAMDKFIEENCKKKAVAFWYSKERSWKTSIMRQRRHEYVYAFKKAAEKREQNVEIKKFQEHQVPIFVDNVLNDCLKDFEFYRVIDPYTAYQELQMYWSSGMAPEKPIPEVSDADMLIAKGFDPKTSFRKDPGGKKRKRKKKK